MTKEKRGDWRTPFAITPTSLLSWQKPRHVRRLLEQMRELLHATGRCAADELQAACVAVCRDGIAQKLHRVKDAVGAWNFPLADARVLLVLYRDRGGQYSVHLYKRGNVKRRTISAVVRKLLTKIEDFERMQSEMALNSD